MKTSCILYTRVDHSLLEENQKIPMSNGFFGMKNIPHVRHISDMKSCWNLHRLFHYLFTITNLNIVLPMHW